jgi:hypothetical protein
MLNKDIKFKFNLIFNLVVNQYTKTHLGLRCLSDIKVKMCDGQEILLKGVKHVLGLRTNLISLGILHEKGWLYQETPDKSTLRVMHGGKTVMVGEKSCAHQYKLKGSVVGGGVMDGNASMVVFYLMVGEVAAASSGCSK